MSTRRSLTIALALVGASALLAACSSSSSSTESSAPAASTAPAASSTAAPASGPPSAELTAWAGSVCDSTASLRDSVTGIAGAVTSGGTDIGASLQGQFTSIQTAASDLVTTVQAIPADGSSPEAQAVKQSADASRAAIDALGQSITELTNASGLGTVAALAGVGSAAKDALSALGGTVDTISQSISSGTGTVGQAFAASPSCTALQQ